MNIFLFTSVPVVPPWDQGDKNLAYMLAGALPQHRFRILTARDEPAPLGANLDLLPLYRTRNPSVLQKAHIYWRLLVQSAWGQASRAADLYHLMYRPHRLSSCLLKWLPEFHRLPTVHTMPATADGLPLSSDLFFAGRVVVLSQHGRQALERLGVRGVVHIPPGIEVDRWSILQGQQSSMRSRLGLSDGPLVLFPGHYGHGQGADVILRALPRIAARVPDVHVVFACRPRSLDDQARERVIRQTVARMGLSRHVHFYNTVADVRVLVGACDLVALPLQTMRDKLDIPTTLLESLAAGKPIVISDLAPMNELMGQSGDPTGSCDEVGRAVPPGDAAALADAIVELLQDSHLRHRMGKRGQAMVYDCYDMRRVADQYEKLYQELAACPRGPG